jgi:hypothetical protein
MARALELMKLAVDRLRDEMPVDQTQHFDDADCDGFCLADDLESEAEELEELLRDLGKCGSCGGSGRYKQKGWRDGTFVSEEVHCHKCKGHGVDPRVHAIVKWKDAQCPSS